MTKQKFEQAKKELSLLCLEYEKLQKQKAIIDNAYLQTFGQLMYEELSLSILCDKYHNAIGMKMRGDSNEDISKMINVAFEPADKKLQELELRHKNALKNPTVDSTMNEEYLLKVEGFFEEYCLKYHPFLNLVDEQFNKNWSYFVYFYQHNSLTGMAEMVNDFKINEEVKDYDLLNKKFDDCTKFIQNEINSTLDNYPLNVRSFLEEDVVEAKITGDYRASIYEKKELLTKYEEEYKKLYADVKIF